MKAPADFIKFRDIAFAQLKTMQQNGVLVRVNVPRENLYSAYLDNFKEEDNPVFRTNRVHDCNTDKSFLKAVGNIVAIDENYNLTYLWDIVDDVPEMYKGPVAALLELVKEAPISAPMCWHQAAIGARKSISVSPNSLGETFYHFYGELASSYVDASGDFGPTIDKITSARQSFVRIMDTVSEESLDTVLDLVNEGLLKRGEQHRGKLERIIAMYREYHKLDANKQVNYAWRAAVLNPHYLPRYSSAIMVAITMVEEGTELVDVVNKYNTSVVGASYQTITSVVTKRQAEDAKRFLVEAGLRDSLEKRHTTTSDMSINDVLFADSGVKFKDSDPFDEVFDDLVSDSESRNINVDNAQEIGIEDFIKKIPDIASMEVLFTSRHKANLCNIISQKHEDAPSIHPWGNGSTWSYNGDVADAIMERVKAAGGVHDAENCVTLHWDYTDDLDLALKTPDGTVYYGRRYVAGATLDVDMNVHGESTSPVENIFWDGEPVDGKYKVMVNNFNRRSSGQGFGLRLSASGKVTEYHYNRVLSNKEAVEALSFNVVKGEITDITVLNHELVVTGGTKEEVWGLSTNTFVPVDTMMLSPNFWKGVRHGHKHYMFMLRDCKNPESVRSFYNEQLNPELKKYRKAMGVVGGRLRVPYSENQMAGLGFSESERSELVVKAVHRSSGSKLYKVMF